MTRKRVEFDKEVGKFVIDILPEEIVNSYKKVYEDYRTGKLKFSSTVHTLNCHLEVLLQELHQIAACKHIIEEGYFERKNKILNEKVRSYYEKRAKECILENNTELNDNKI